MLPFIIVAFVFAFLREPGAAVSTVVLGVLASDKGTTVTVEVVAPTTPDIAVDERTVARIVADKLARDSAFSER